MLVRGYSSRQLEPLQAIVDPPAVKVTLSVEIRLLRPRAPG